MSRATALLAVAALAPAAACGGTSRPGEEKIPIPARRSTAGDRILALAPAGADAVLEIDVARLRGNAAVGPLVRAVTASQLARPDLIGAADLLLVCSYRVGESDAGQILFAAGAEARHLQGARVLEPDLVAIAPPALLDRIELVRAGAQPSLAADRALLRVRALGMPERAEGASLRVSARLGFEGRLALARRFELDAMPAWLSLWLDVADDLAMVALLAGDGAGEAQELARAVARLRDRLAESPPVRSLGLTRTVAATQVEVRGTEVRVVLLVGPRRLGRLVDRVQARLTAPGPAAPQAPAPATAEPDPAGAEPDRKDGGEAP